MIQCRAARWVLGRYNRLDSVTDMLSSLQWKSLELRQSDTGLCMLYKQSNGLATSECDKLQREHESRMDTRISSLSHMATAIATCWIPTTATFVNQQMLACLYVFVHSRSIGVMVSKRGAIRNIRIEKNLPDQICNMCDSQCSKPCSLALLIPKGRKEFPKVLSRLTYSLISVSPTVKGIVTSNKQLMLYHHKYPVHKHRT